MYRLNVAHSKQNKAPTFWFWVSGFGNCALVKHCSCSRSKIEYIIMRDTFEIDIIKIECLSFFPSRWRSVQIYDYEIEEG